MQGTPQIFLKCNLKIVEHILQGQLAAFGTFNHT